MHEKTEMSAIFLKKSKTWNLRLSELFKLIKGTCDILGIVKSFWQTFKPFKSIFIKRTFMLKKKTWMKPQKEKELKSTYRSSSHLFSNKRAEKRSYSFKQQFYGSYVLYNFQS